MILGGCIVIGYGSVREKTLQVDVDVAVDRGSFFICKSFRRGPVRTTILCMSRDSTILPALS
jgi:hypothetical protein